MAAVVERQKRALGSLDQAGKLERSFASLRYWATDLAVSWLNESEQNMETAKEEFAVVLGNFEATHPKIVGDLRSGADEFSEAIHDFMHD